MNGRRSAEFNKLYNLANRKISVAGKSCEKCGSEEKLHRHHPDYSKPLEVVILCHKCHFALHKREIDTSKTDARNGRIAAHYQDFLDGNATRAEMNARIEAEGVDPSRANPIYRKVKGLVGASKRKPAA